MISILILTLWSLRIHDDRDPSDGHLNLSDNLLIFRCGEDGGRQLGEEPFEGLAEYSVKSHLVVWQSTLSGAIWMFGRVLCQEPFQGLAEYSVTAIWGFLKVTLPQPRGLLPGQECWPLYKPASGQVTQWPKGQEGGRPASLLQRRDMLILSSDWDWAWAGIGDWDWGLGLGPGIGDCGWGLGLGTGDGDLGLGTGDGNWDWDWGLGMGTGDGN